MTSSEEQRVASATHAWFTTTHWTVILAAAGPTAPEASEALEKLCRAYWYPLYAYVRRRGYAPHDAQDLTQEFFARLLARNFLQGVAADKGRFRSFLLASLNHFLADEWDKARAQKRGGNQFHLSLDATTGEDRYQLEPADDFNAEKLFERRWAAALLEQARSRLETEYVESGRAELYQRLRTVEAGSRATPPYAQLGAEVGLSESAVKSAVFRMRRRYHELLREEVAGTVSGPSEIDEEIRYLITVLS